MAGVRRTKSKTGRLHARWRLWYIDAEGKRRWETGTSNKAETLRHARELEEKHRQMRIGMRPLSRVAPVKYEDATEEYCQWGEAQGGRGGRPWGPKHALNRRRHLPWWGDTLALESVSELRGSLSRVEKALRELRATRTGKTVSNYVESLGAFCDWAVVRGYLEAHPLKGLKRFDTTPEATRRAMTPEEVTLLIKHAPLERGLTYAVAVSSGLRAGELKQLRVRDLDTTRCGIHLSAAWTKNRKTDFQDLPAGIVARLAHAAKGKGLEDPLLYVPRNAADAFDKDLKRAGIKKHTPEGKVDFHGLRVTYATVLVESGANVRETQSLMRHSTPNLTMGIYAKTREARRGQLADQVGERLGFNPQCGVSVQRAAVGAEPKPPTRDGARGLRKGGMVREAGLEPAPLAGLDP